jgi:TP901 family phage tail tape measure protein
MPASSNKYTLTLQAKIDTTQVDAQIKQLQAQLSTLNIGGGGGAAGTGASSAATTTANVAAVNKSTTANTAQAKSVQNVGTAVKSAAKETKGWTTEIVQNAGKVISWAISTTAIYGTLKLIGSGIQYITELNKELTNISIVTGMTRGQTTALASDYNKLAISMGVTTKSIAEGSLEWFRQGKTVEETTALVKNSLMLATLGNIEAAQSTEYLTAILNGFQMKTEDLGGAIDKLVNLDNNYATSVAEIASAMQRSSNSAMIAGVSFDQLASYITIVSSTTRKSAESIGESFKTMFARMQSVKAGAQIDDMGESLNNVEKTLKTFNIALRDQADTFRPLGDVIGEVASKWSEYSNVEQSEIATAIAGVRQRENFLVLMNNYNKVLEAQAIETDSAGLAQQRYGIYLQGVEAAANKFKATWEGIWQKTITSDAIKTFYNLASVVGTTIDKMGGLIPIIVAVGVAVAILNGPAIIGALVNTFFTLNQAILAFSTLLTGASTTMAVFQASIPVIGIALAAIALVWGVVAYNTKTASEELQKLNQEIETYKGNISSLESESKTLYSLAEEYDTLREKTNKSIDEQKRFLEIQQQIAGIVPQVILGYDNEGNAILDATVPMQTYIDLQQQRINNDKIILSNTIAQSFSENAKGYETEDAKLKKYLDDYEIYKVIMEKGYGVNQPGTLWDDLTKKYKSLDNLGLMIRTQSAVVSNSLITLTQDYAKLTPELQNYVRAQLESLGLSQDIIDTIVGEENVYRSVANAKAAASDASNENASANSAEIPTIDELTSSTANLASETDALISIMQKQKDGTLKPSDIAQLVTAHAELAQFVHMEGDAFIFDSEAAKAYLKAQIAIQQGALGTAIAIGADTAKIQAQIVTLQAALAMLNAPINFSGGGGGSAKSLAQTELEALKKLKEAEKEALKEKLAGYKDIIDARKAILKSMHDEADYQDVLRDKEKSVAKIQSELLAISLDNSEEAQARRLELQDQLVKAQDDLNKTQSDRAYELQVEALDKEYKLYEDMINAQIKLIDDFIKTIEDKLSKLTNSTGGGGNPPPSSSTLQYDFGNIRSISDPAGDKFWTDTRFEKRGYGAEGGLISGGMQGVDSVNIKAMPGEFLLQKSAVDSLGINALHKLNSGSHADIGNGANIGTLLSISVNGSLDKTVIPDLNRIVDKVMQKMNESFKRRGVTRATNQYSS